MLGGGDAMEHLARAVREDSRMLARIDQDPVCGRHPQIIQKLKTLVVDDSGALGVDSNAEDGRVP